MLLLLLFVSLTTVVTAQSSSSTATDDSEDMDEYILAPSPILKISSPVRNIIWSNDSSLFAFSDEKNLIIADGKTNAISEIIHTDGIIRDIQVSRGASNEDEELLMLSGSNGVMLHALRKGAKTVFQKRPGGTVSAIAVSDNGQYQAIATGTGPIELNMKLQLTGDVYTKTITGHKTGPYSLNFSPDSRYLASASDDGFVRVIRLEDYKTVAREPFANYLHAPVIFTAGNSSVFMAMDEHTVNRTLVTGSIWMAENKTYVTEQPIISYAELTANSRTRQTIGAAISSYLVVLTEDQHFVFFDAETQEALGYIPQLAKSRIADFAFSTDGTELLIGYEDGNILRVDSTYYWRPMWMKVEVLYASYYSNAVKGGTGPAIFEHDENGLIPFGYMLPADSFFDYADITTEVSRLGLFTDRWEIPFNMGMSLSEAVIHSVGKTPLYIGLGGCTGLYIPDSDFPFTYKDGDGNLLQPPFLVSSSLSAVVGFQMKIATGTFLFAQISGGPGVKILWAPLVAHSKPFISGAGAASVGAQVNGLRLSVDASYDSIAKISIGGSLGVRLSLHDREGM